MLRSMPATMFFEWIAYSTLEPFGEERDDYRAASICQMIHNINVKREHQKKLTDFVLNFGETKQTWQQQKALFMMMVTANIPGGES
jgi:hypothetical protein